MTSTRGSKLSLWTPTHLDDFTFPRSSSSYDPIQSPRRAVFQHGFNVAVNGLAVSLSVAQPVSFPSRALQCNSRCFLGCRNDMDDDGSHGTNVLERQTRDCIGEGLKMKQGRGWMGRLGGFKRLASSHPSSCSARPSHLIARSIAVVVCGGYNDRRHPSCTSDGLEICFVRWRISVGWNGLEQQMEIGICMITCKLNTPRGLGEGYEIACCECRCSSINNVRFAK